MRIQLRRTSSWLLCLAAVSVLRLALPPSLLDHQGDGVNLHFLSCGCLRLRRRVSVLSSFCGSDSLLQSREKQVS